MLNPDFQMLPIKKKTKNPEIHVKSLVSWFTWSRD